MQPEIIVAVLALAGVIITSAVGAYAAIKKDSNKYFSELRKDAEAKTAERDIQLAVLSSKVDTLWDIYAEDAIRQARASGMVATKSPLAPTEMWQDSLTADLTEDIEQDAIEFSKHLSSPYDIAIEIWNKYKYDLVSRNKDSDIRALWGTVLIVSINAVKQENLAEV